MPNLFVVRSAGACPRIREIVTPGVYFYLSFLLFDVIAHLPRSHRQTDRVGAKSPIFYLFSPVSPQP